MRDIIRRKTAVPVEARRVEPEPPTIQIPGAVPPPSPGVTQNIIHVNVPSAAPAPQPAPADQRQVHYHTTNVYLPAPTRRRRGTSFFGTLGFVLGGVAGGAAYVPPLVWLAKPIALGGLASAGLGMLGAILLGRVGKVMPLFGILLSAIAYGLWMKNTGLKLPVELPKINFNLVAPPPVVNSPAPVSNPPAVVKPADPTRLHDHSIFGDGTGTWTKPSNPPVTVSPPSVPSAPAALVDVDTAKSNLETARENAAKQLGLDYDTTKSTAAAADAQYQQAKMDELPGSAELIAASKAHLDADSQLNLMLIKLRLNPNVAACEQALKNARASGD
jgi:hypothetical protein